MRTKKSKRRIKHRSQGIKAATRKNKKTEIHETIEEIKKLNQQIKALAKKKPSRSLQTLQKKLDEIDWEIQTTSLNLREEKELVDQVGKLETQVNIHKKT